MRVAIPKLNFPIDPQDNMEEYLKNTEKVAADTLSMLDREQKINVVNISYFQSCHFLDIKALLSRELPRHLTKV